MDNDWDEWRAHILAEIKRFNKEHSLFSRKMSKFDSRLDRYNEILIRNTVSLEEHIKRTNLLEKKVDHVETEVGGLRDHLSLVKSVFSIVKFFGTTKGKIVIKWALVFGAGVASYFAVIKDWIAYLIN